MYSKERGITYGGAPTSERRLPFGEPAYRRTHPVRVPVNYSGHAIVDGEERPLGELMPTAENGERSGMPTPHFEGLPRVSELGETRRHGSLALPQPVRDAEELPPYGKDDPPDEPEDLSPTALIPAPLITVGGHGLGTEELLLLGLILFLLLEGGEQEDKGDLTETVILLGILFVLGW